MIVIQCIFFGGKPLKDSSAKDYCEYFIRIPLYCLSPYSKFKKFKKVQDVFIRLFGHRLGTIYNDEFINLEGIYFLIARTCKVLLGYIKYWTTMLAVLNVACVYFMQHTMRNKQKILLIHHTKQVSQWEVSWEKEVLSAVLSTYLKKNLIIRSVQKIFNIQSIF